MKIEIIKGTDNNPVAEFFSSSSTPETDAMVEASFNRINFPTAPVPAEFARKLERERDEARESLKHIGEYGTEEINAAVELRQKLASALVERDEAREELAGIENKMRVELGGHPDSELWGEAGLIAATMRCVDAVGELTEQRDEAREALASREVVIAQQNVITYLILERNAARESAEELSDIASKHLSFLLAITPTKPNEKHEKETEKVINALKRWKKL